MADHVLVVNSKVCTGCRTCEIVCSLSHAQECNPQESRIRVVQREDQGLDFPVVCQQCKVAICRTVCPSKAISRDVDSGAVMIDSDKCTGCELCVFACFFGAIKIRRVGKRGKAFVCDLCGGDPLCTKFCDTGAVSFRATDKITMEKKSESMREILFHVGRTTSNSHRSRLLAKITEVREDLAESD